MSLQPSFLAAGSLVFFSGTCSMAQILHNQHTLHLLNYLFLFAFSLRLSFCLLQAPPALQAQIVNATVGPESGWVGRICLGGNKTRKNKRWPCDLHLFEKPLPEKSDLQVPPPWLLICTCCYLCRCRWGCGLHLLSYPYAKLRFKRELVLL